METLVKDVGYAVRMLAKSPVTTGVALLSLALGIGANTAMFSWMTALLLDPLRVEEPARLVHLYSTNPSGFRASYSYLNYRDERDRNHVFTGMVAVRSTPVSFAEGERSERVFATLVSGNYWETMGVKAALGRTFTPVEDEVEGRDAVAVVSHAFWQRRFGGDPSLVGKSVRLNNYPFTIAGILPEDYRYATVSIDADVYAPLTMMNVLIPGADRLNSRGWGFLQVTARLRPDVSLEQAQAHMDVIAEGLAREYSGANEDRGVLLVPEREALLPQGAQGAMTNLLGILTGVVAFVLLIACANVANLQMARAKSRELEVSVRLALGAARQRLLRQLLTESLVLSVAAGLVGIGLAHALNRLVVGFQPPMALPVSIDVPLDTGVLVFTLLVTLATAILFGLAPALRASRTDALSSLKGDSTRVVGRSAFRNVLVAGQMALSVVLLIGAGLFLRSLQAAQNIDPGFDPDGVLLAAVDPELSGYDRIESRSFYERLQSAVASLPGVRSVTMAENLPMEFGGSQWGVVVEGYEPAPNERMNIDYNTVTPGYFETMRIPLLLGRDFGPQDRDDAQGALIVNEAMANRFWPGESPLGRKVRTGGRDRVVVGVVGTTKLYTLGEDPVAQMFFPYQQTSFGAALQVHTRTESDPLALADAVRAEVRALDPTLPVFDVRTMNDRIALALLPSRLSAGVLGSFGLVALLMAAVGIYGVMAYSVTQKTREFGLRMALGATGGDVVKLVLRQTTRLATVGIGLGLMGGLAVGRLASGLLFGTSPNDPGAFAAAAALIFAVAVAASYVPARRAVAVDPVRSLRHE